MIYSTAKSITEAFVWNTGGILELDKNVELSDYTELEDEFDEKTLKETFDYWVCTVNNRNNMSNPRLMLVTTGFYKSCRVWIDQSLLIVRPDIFDPLQGFEFYS